MRHGAVDLADSIGPPGVHDGQRRGSHTRLSLSFSLPALTEGPCVDSCEALLPEPLPPGSSGGGGSFGEGELRMDMMPMLQRPPRLVRPKAHQSSIRAEVSPDFREQAVRGNFGRAAHLVARGRQQGMVADDHGATPLRRRLLEQAADHSEMGRSREEVRVASVMKAIRDIKRLGGRPSVEQVEKHLRQAGWPEDDLAQMLQTQLSSGGVSLPKVPGVSQDDTWRRVMTTPYRVASFVPMTQLEATATEPERLLRYLQTQLGMMPVIVHPPHDETGAVVSMHFHDTQAAGRASSALLLKHKLTIRRHGQFLIIHVGGLSSLEEVETFAATLREILR